MTAVRIPTCDWAWSPFLELRDAHAVFSPNTDSYDAFAGVGLGRNMKFAEMYTMTAANATQTAALLPHGSVQHGSCDGDDTDVGFWRISRIGPFRSTGGYDWWQFGWGDVGRLEELQATLKSHRVGLTGHWSGMVDSSGTPMGLPPFHAHHIHLVPSRYSYENMMAGEGCLVEGKGCLDPSAIMQHHGDHICLSDEGGTDCLLSDYSEFGTHLVHESLSIIAELNDVRQAGAPPMAWYYQIAMRILVDPALPALSNHATANNGVFKLTGKASDLLALDRLPTTVDSYHFYTGRVPFAGRLAYVEYHSHARPFQKAFLFAATTSQLGLDRAPFWPTHPYESVITTTTGLANNSMLEVSLRMKLLAANLAFRASELMGHTSATSASSGPSALRNEPRLICTAVGVREQVGDEWYDRQAQHECVDDWHFDHGSVFTNVQLNGPTTAVGAKSFEGMGRRMDDAAPPDFDFGQHDSWFMEYLADDGLSHYTTGVYSQTLDVVSPYLDRLTMLRFTLHGYQPVSPMGPAERALIAVLIAITWLTGQSPLLILLILALLTAAPTLACCFKPRGGDGSSCCCCCLESFFYVAVEIYFVSLTYYLYLPPNMMGLNAQDTVLLSVRPRVVEEFDATLVQLMASLGLLVIGIAGTIALKSKCKSASSTQVRNGVMF